MECMNLISPSSAARTKLGFSFQQSLVFLPKNPAIFRHMPSYSLFKQFCLPSIKSQQPPERQHIHTHFLCMAATSSAVTPSFLHKLNRSSALHPSTKQPHSTPVRRRSSSIILITTFLLSTKPEPAAGFEFRMTVPDQTLQEAEAGIQSHAKSLLNVKDLLMAESWKDAQKLLRKSSSLLKQDIYTIIQAKRPGDRPRLRKLYSDLFNGVTQLDYAARDKDRVLVWDSYNAIVLALDDILSRV